jgi:hypothetical protein
MEAATPENGWYYNENEDKRVRVPGVYKNNWKGKTSCELPPEDGAARPFKNRVYWYGVPRNEKEIDMKNINERGHEQSRDKIHKCHQVKGRQNIVWINKNQ